MSDEEDFKVNSASHKKLLSDINDIVKFQHVTKPKRSEPAIKNDEFHLVKTKSLKTNDNDDSRAKGDKKNITVSSLASVVRKNEKQKKISSLFQDTFKNEKVLKKPLEKVYADRVQRTVAYDNTKNKLSRWDAVVTKNKNADQLKFPLNQEKTFFKERNQNSSSFPQQFRYKSKVVQEMEEIHNECFPKSEETTIAENDSELLTLDEMKERRKEMARLKMRESNKIAKKRLQSKIKSKKYHRLRKRDELKKKLKEFEELKATNPEAALKELEKIEKQRIQERVNLRHKNTGTWAKNMKVRAQYDTTAKQEIEAQLALSRELTQKQQQDSSDSESEEDLPTNATGKTDNPWLSEQKNGDSMDELFSGYRKIWEEKNANDRALRKLKKIQGAEDKQVSNDDDDDDEKSKESEQLSDDNDESIDSDSNSENAQNDSKGGWAEEDASSDNGDEDPSNFINDLFDAAEENINKKMESKLKELKPKLLGSLKPPKKKMKKRKLEKKVNVNDPKYLEFERSARIGDIDEALLEGSDEEQDVNIGLPPSKKLALEIEKIRDEKKAFMRGTKGEIDPNSFLKVKSKHLLTAIPKGQEFDDADEEELNNLQASNKMSLAEAFENDDIIQDFVAEIEEETDQAKGMNGNALPGWGHWAGEGVKNKKNKYHEKASTVKKKDRVIVNTTPHESLKKHLVSTVPFPFKTIQDFEASLRIPIGKDFIPSRAHSKLTMESIVTKAGMIIEPMSEEALVKTQNEKRKNHFKKQKFMKNNKMKKFVK